MTKREKIILDNFAEKAAQGKCKLWWDENTWNKNLWYTSDSFKEEYIWLMKISKVSIKNTEKKFNIKIEKKA